MRCPAFARRDRCAAMKTGTCWDVNLDAYDVVAASFSAPGVRLYNPVVAWPGEVRVALEKRLSDLAHRAAALSREPPTMNVLENPNFDSPPRAQERIPGWFAIAPSGVTVQLDAAKPHEGTQSVRLSSTGPAGSLISRPFPPPSTGRLTISLWLRTADVNHQPSFQVAVEGQSQGRNFFRFAPFGQAPGAAHPRPIPSEWSIFYIRIDDIPLDALSAIRLRFELLGPGEVWIDDVQLCELYFERPEHLALLRLITPAHVQLQNNQISDCLRLLDGYWPRFLMEHVQVAETPAPRRTENGDSAPTDPEQAASLLDRLKTIVPPRLRF